MADVIFIAIALGFSGICVAFVRACDRLIGSSGGGTAAETKHAALDEAAS